VYQQIADQTRDIIENNNAFVERESEHVRKQLEKEISKATAEHNEDQLRVLEDKLFKSKEIEEAYAAQFALLDQQIQELLQKLQDREEDINQLEEILDDKDKYIKQL